MCDSIVVGTNPQPNFTYHQYGFAVTGVFDYKIFSSGVETSLKLAEAACDLQQTRLQGWTDLDFTSPGIVIAYAGDPTLPAIDPLPINANAEVQITVIDHVNGITISENILFTATI